MRGSQFSRRGLFGLVSVGAAAVLGGSAEAAGRVTSVQVGGAISALAVNPVTGLGYAADQASGRVVVLDPDAGRVVAALAVGGEPSDVVADAERIYVANPAGGTVLAFDSQTHRFLSAVSAGPGASALAIDPQVNLVYAVSGKTGTFAVLDSVSLTQQDLLPAPKPGLAGIALDRGRRRAYCTSPNTNSVEICDLDTGAFTASVPVGRPRPGSASTN